MPQMQEAAVMTARPDGFYRVRHRGQWCVAHFGRNSFALWEWLAIYTSQNGLRLCGPIEDIPDADIGARIEFPEA